MNGGRVTLYVCTLSASMHGGGVIQNKRYSTVDMCVCVCVCVEYKHAWEEGRTEQAVQCRGIVCMLSASTHGRRVI